jgi:uncharacterized membrane protein
MSVVPKADIRSMEEKFVVLCKAADRVGRFFAANLRNLLSGIAAFLAIASVAAPILILLGFDSFGAGVYTALSYVCHQERGRCLSLGGAAFGICSRCFGGYVAFYGASRVFTPRRRISRHVHLVIRVAFALALADALLQLLGVYHTGNIPRLASGLALGIGFGRIAFTFVSTMEGIE